MNNQEKTPSMEVLESSMISYNNVYKDFIYKKYSPRPKKEIRIVIRQFILEHNNSKDTKFELSFFSHSVPYWLYQKIVRFFETN